MIAAEDFIRPSSLEAGELCSGRPTMEARACVLVPALQHVTSDVARQGTLGHEVIASVLTDALWGNWSGASRAVASLEARMGDLEPWCQDAVRRCIAYAFGVVRIWTDKGQVEGLAEVHLDGMAFGLVRGGTADFVLLVRRGGRVVRVIVVDWKTGWLSQGEAADHVQLMAYAVLAAHRWQPSEGVEVHLAMGRRCEFSSAFYDPEALNAAGDRVRRIAMRCQSELAKLNPSTRACRYCKALPLCRAARGKIMEAQEAHALFGARPADRITLADDAALAKAFVRSAEELAKIWREEEAAKDAEVQQ